MQIYIHSTAHTHEPKKKKNGRKICGRKIYSISFLFTPFLHFKSISCAFDISKRSPMPLRLVSSRLVYLPFIAFNVVQVGLLQYSNADKQNIHAHRTHIPRPTTAFAFASFLFDFHFSLFLFHSLLPSSGIKCRTHSGRACASRSLFCTVQRAAEAAEWVSECERRKKKRLHVFDGPPLAAHRQFDKRRIMCNNIIQT